LDSGSVTNRLEEHVRAVLGRDPIITADHQQTGAAAQTVQDPLHPGRLKISGWIVTQDYQLVLAVAQIAVSRQFLSRSNACGFCGLARIRQKAQL